PLPPPVTTATFPTSENMPQTMAPGAVVFKNRATPLNPSLGRFPLCILAPEVHNDGFGSVPPLCRPGGAGGSCEVSAYGSDQCRAGETFSRRQCPAGGAEPPGRGRQERSPSGAAGRGPGAEAE